MQLPGKSFHFADTSHIYIFTIRYVCMACIMLIQNIKPGGVLEGLPLFLVSSHNAASPYKG